MTQDPTADEMRAFLRGQYGAEAEDFDVEEAIYWFAAAWHGGQDSNLYSALSTSEYSPGPITRGPERGGLSVMMLGDLEQEYTVARAAIAKTEGRP